MDSTPVNWEALDALVIDFAKSENLIEDSFSSAPDSPPSSPSSSSSSLSSSSYHSRLTIWKIRRSLEAGDIDIAMDLLSSHAPFILDDHRLLFRLHKQVSLVCAVFGSRENALANRKIFFYCQNWETQEAYTIWVLLILILVCFLQTLSFGICFYLFDKISEFGIVFIEEIHWAVEKRGWRKSRLCNCLREDSSRALCSWCLSGNYKISFHWFLYFLF